MTGAGTLMNAGGILLGGILGRTLGKKINHQCQETLVTANGLCLLLTGINGTIQNMMFVQDGKLISTDSVMMISSLLLGSLIGEWLNIEGRMECFGEWIKKRSGNGTDDGFINGFVTATMTVCIGGMAVVGALQDGVKNDISILMAKTLIDMVNIMALSSVLGCGCIFSVIPVMVFQGSITFLARAAAPLFTEQAVTNISLTGAVLICFVGINLVWKKKIPVANMLPSVFIAVVWTFLFG